MPTIYQIYVFMAMVYGGILSGIVIDIFKPFSYLKSKSKIINIALDFVCTLIIIALFLLCLHISNFGIFRFFLLFSFILGIVVEQYSIGFLVAKIINLLYNIVRFILKKFTLLYKKIFPKGKTYVKD